MKKILIYAFHLIVLAGMFVSCQDDSVTENIPNALGPSSQLTGVLSSITANNDITINVIDSVACFNIKLPIQVTANGQQIDVINESDYATVEAVFNQSNDDVDHLGYVYPFTIIFPDNTETIVATDQQYYNILNACNWDPTAISSDCVSLNYPITVLGYDSSYQQQNSYTFNNDAEVYTMLLNLGANEYYAITYPVSLTVAGQQIVTVNSNTELQQAITDAVAACGQGPVGCQNPGVLTDGLIIYMPFSHSIADLKGAIVEASIDTLFVADRNNNPACAISFSGGYPVGIQMDAANALVTGSELSISIWFKMQNTVGNNLEHMFTKGSGGAGGFHLSVYDGNTPLFGVSAIELWDTSWIQDATLPTDTTNWHHLVATLDANNNAKLYRDGILQNSQAFDANGIGSSPLNYFIGEGFTGYLDDLRVYNRVLTGAEVQTLFELDGDCNTCLQ